jgi:hypothetical protein
MLSDVPLKPLSEDEYWTHHKAVADHLFDALAAKIQTPEQYHEQYTGSLPEILSGKIPYNSPGDLREQYMGSINDAVNNAYQEGISPRDWAIQARDHLGISPEVIPFNVYRKP